MTPAEREAFDVASDMDDSLDEIVRRYEGSPTMTAALREAGMSAREFAVMTLSVVQSGMAVAVLQITLAATGYCLGCRLYFLRWYVPGLFTRLAR